MAFGNPPKYIHTLYFDDFTPGQFLVLLIETARKLKMEIRHKSEAGLIAYTTTAKLKSWNSKVTVVIEEDKAIIKSESTGKELADLGRNRKVIDSFIDALADIKQVSNPAESEQKFDELKPDLVSPEQDILIHPQEVTGSISKDFFSIFIPGKDFFITPVLVDLNILIFILMAISGVNILLPDNESLIRWGANFRPITLEGQSWRLITNTFLHIGIIHLLLNMYALVYIGILLEPRLGKARFAAAYFLTGIIASVSSLWWHDLTISAGASGAIFGMYGVFLAMLTTNLIEKTTRKALLTSIAVFVLYNLMNGMKGGIDNAAHVGGLIGGLIIGYVYINGLKKPGEKKLKYSVIGILAIFVISASFIIVRRIPNDIGEYDKKLKSFSGMERKALAVFRLPKTTGKDKLLSEIQDSGIYYWNECSKLINEMERLNIPEAFHYRDKGLLQYCDLRIHSYRFLYKKVNEDTNIYNDSVKYYTSRIEAVMRDLKEK